VQWRKGGAKAQKPFWDSQQPFWSTALHYAVENTESQHV